MKDGRLKHCADCVNEKRRARRLINPRTAEMERLVYARNPRRQSGVKSRAKRWTKDHPDKTRVQQKARRALKRGLIQRLPCAFCGSEKSEMHHDDYSKPLEVMWLCRSHHARRHLELKRAGFASGEVSP